MLARIAFRLASLAWRIGSDLSCRREPFLYGVNFYTAPRALPGAGKTIGSDAPGGVRGVGHGFSTVGSRRQCLFRLFFLPGVFVTIKNVGVQPSAFS